MKKQLLMVGMLLSFVGSVAPILDQPEPFSEELQTSQRRLMVAGGFDSLAEKVQEQVEKTSTWKTLKELFPQSSINELYSLYKQSEAQKDKAHVLKNKRSNRGRIGRTTRYGSYDTNTQSIHDYLPANIDTPQLENNPGLPVHGPARNYVPANIDTPHEGNDGEYNDMQGEGRPGGQSTPYFPTYEGGLGGDCDYCD